MVKPRYTVEFYPGEDYERLPEWCVVRWDAPGVGTVVYKTYDEEVGEKTCEDVRAVLQEVYNMELYNEAGA